MQWIIFGMMIGPVPLFFYGKYKKDKKAGNKGGAAFNFGYIIFFFFTSLNELVYIIDAVGEYSAALGWDPILAAKVVVLFESSIRSQILLMMLLFFCSFIPIMYPVEKYIQNSEKMLVSKLLIIGAIGMAIAWFTFCYLRIPQPIDFIPFQIIFAILTVVIILGFLVSIFSFIYSYMKLAAKSTGIIRKKALIVTFGLLFMYISLVAGNLIRPDVVGTPLELIGPILLTLGIVILIYGFKIKAI